MKENIISDLALAASLYALGHNVEVKGRDGQRVNFSFGTSKKVRQAIDLYWRRELLIEPNTYFVAIRHLKNLIYNT